MGRVSPHAQEAAVISRRAWRPQLQHMAAAVVGIVIFALVFTYTGDSDLLIALTSGMGGILMVYLLAQLSSAPREKE
jgi:hypothetical protein